MIPKTFYRYEERQTYNGLVIDEINFRMTKETLCGYWIQLAPVLWQDDKKIWVSKTSKKRYAYPDKMAAIKGLIFRKERQIDILESKIKLAKTAYSMALEMIESLIAASSV